MHDYEDMISMASEVPSCELVAVELSEDYIIDIEAFLEVYPMTAFEGQILIEVCKFREHHIDVNTLTKKIPKEFFVDPSNDLNRSLKDLIMRNLLSPYEGKKDVLCVLATKFGRAIANQIRERCFSEALRFFDIERKKIDARKRRLVVDPLGLKVGERRRANGPRGKTEVVIKGLYSSDTKHTIIEGKVKYERRVVANIKCPQCGSDISIEYCFNPISVYKKRLEIECGRCTYHFFLAYYLYKYWE